MTATSQFVAGGNASCEFVAAANYARELVHLGLGGAARRFLERAGVNAPIGSPVQEALAAVSAAPVGRVEWCARSAVLERNLSVLSRRDAEAAQRLSAAARDGLADYELYRIAGGNFQILDLRTLTWCGGLVDHRAAAATAFDGERALAVGMPLVFDGIGLGYLFEEFLRRSRNVFMSYSPAVDVVEPDPLALAMVLHLRDWTEQLSAERVTIFVGPDAESRYLAALNADPARPAPRTVQRCILTPRPPTRLHETLGSVWERRAARKTRLKTALETRHGDHGPRWWAERYRAALEGGGRPLRVMGVTSRFTTVLRYSMSELLAAAERAGCATHMCWEASDHANDSDIIGAIEAFEPDLVLIISRMRHEIPEIVLGIPCVTWDQDNLPCMRTEAAGASLDRLTFLVGYGAQVGLSQLGWPATQALAVAPAAMAGSYDDTPVAAELRARFACDICYVSHCSETPEALRDRLAGNWAFHPLLATLFRESAGRIVEASAAGHNWTPAEIFALIDEAARARNLTLEPAIVRELFTHCTTISDRAFRHCGLNWAARYAEETGRTLRLYGNGWERHPRFARFAAGVARFGEEFRAACQAGRINLQLIEGGFIHSRSLDGLAAGGFFLTRATRWDALRPAIRTLGAAMRERGVASAAELTNVDDPDVAAVLSRLGDARGVDWWIRTILPTPDALERFPLLPDISFDSYESFAGLCHRYIPDETARSAIASEMRAIAGRHFSYDRHFQDILAFVRGSLSR